MTTKSNISNKPVSTFISLATGLHHP